MDLLSTILERARGRRRVLFLDYDGTLVPFAEKPHLALPDPALLELLGAVASRHDTAVHIVTGRSRSSIEGWLGHLPIGLHAEHGYWSREHREAEWVSRRPRAHDWQIQAKVLMSASVVAAPGSFIEEKESCLAWHYRLADPERAATGFALLHTLVQPLAARHGLEVMNGASVLELRERGVNKGHVVRDILGLESRDVFVAAVGDDVTDGDMFAVLPPDAFAIAASSRPATAHVRVDGHEPVRELLRRLCEMPSSTPRVASAEMSRSCDG